MYPRRVYVCGSGPKQDRENRMSCEPNAASSSFFFLSFFFSRRCWCNSGPLQLFCVGGGVLVAVVVAGEGALGSYVDA